MKYNYKGTHTCHPSSQKAGASGILAQFGLAQQEPHLVVYYMNPTKCFQIIFYI